MEHALTVLIVDDNTDFLDVAADALTIMGYEVQAMSDPQEALARVDRAPAFDILVVDLRLGGSVSGVTVANRARAASPGIPVIFLTGDTGGTAGQPFPGGEVVSKLAGFDALRDALLRAGAAAGSE